MNAYPRDERIKPETLECKKDGHTPKSPVVSADGREAALLIQAF